MCAVMHGTAALCQVIACLGCASNNAKSLVKVQQQFKLLFTAQTGSSFYVVFISTVVTGLCLFAGGLLWGV